MRQGPAQPPAPSPEAVAKGYETSDARFKGLVWFFIIIVIGAVVIHLVVHKTMTFLLRHDQAGETPRSALTTAQTPPPPMIQPVHAADVLPFQDLAAMREHEDETFRKLGWQVDAATHTVRIPAELLQKVQQIEQQPPARTEPTVAQKNANTISPGAPTTQTTHGTALSPQGPGGNRQPPLSEPARKEAK